MDVKAKKTEKKPIPYDPELAKEICDTIASCDDGLKTLCRKNKHWPHYQRIYEWRNSNAEFADMYARAKASQVEVLVDLAWEIARENSNDTIVKKSKSGSEFESCNSEWVNRSRLKVDTIKWLAAILQPKKYSEKYIDKSSAENLVKSIIAKL